MSKSPQFPKSEQIKSELHQHYARLQKRASFSLYLFTISVFLGLLILIFISEHYLFLSANVKTGFLITAIIFSTAFYFWMKSKALQNSFTDFYSAFAKQKNFGELQYFLDLEQDSLADPNLVNAALDANLSVIDVNKLQQELRNYTDTQLSSIRYTNSIKSFTAVAIVLVGLSFFLNPGVSRGLQFWETYAKPNPYNYSISPQHTTIEQGSSLTIQADFKGTLIPKTVQLFVKTSVENDFRSVQMVPSENSFISIPFDLNNDLEYYVKMDEFNSATYSATVQLRPRFSELSATINSLAYTKLDSVNQKYPFSLIKAYQGSTVTLNAILNKEIIDIQLLSSSNSVDSTEINDLTFNANISVIKQDTLSFLMNDKNGLTNKNAFQFIIEPIVDAYPVVELLQPSSSFEMVEPKQIELTYKATDDFDLTRAILKYELKKAYVDQPKSGTVSLKKPQNGVLQQYNWNVSELNLSPLDELTFWIEATDNDGFNGRKTSKSQIITLTVPSLVDYFESLDKKEDEVETELESVSESFQQMSEAYEEFEESLKNNPEPTFENKRQLEETSKRQEEVREKLEELNNKFDEIKKELDENSLLSEETRKTYEELQKLMKEIDDPELQEALQKLRENMDQLTPEQLRRAMEDVKFNEEDYQKRLERTIELFKQLKLMSDLEKLAKSFDDQARQEKELAESPPSTEEAKNKREEDLKQIEKLEKAIDDLSKNSSKKNEKSVTDFQESSSSELDENIRKQIEEWLKEQSENADSDSENSDSDSGDNSESGESQNQQPNLQQPFENLAQKARSLMSSMGQQQQQFNIAGLQYILNSLLMLSHEQEDLVYLTETTEDRSMAYIELARDQRNVEQILSFVSDSLFQISKDVPSFANEINEKTSELQRQLERALKQMAERSQRNSTVASRQAFGGINEIAFMIANVLEQLQDQQNSGQGGAGGSPSMQQMMEQMGKMKGNQQQINQQIQQMINDMQGERLSQDQMERLDQLAKQQNSIRKQLQELQRNGAIEGGDKLGSEIQRMIDEMEDTINDLRGGAVDPTLIKRQQNILSRMLDAEKSMQERDEEEKEREGKSVREFERATPPEMTLEELEKQIRSRLNDPNFTKYSPDYQKLIERYFELLKKLQERGS